MFDQCNSHDAYQRVQVGFVGVCPESSTPKLDFTSRPSNFNVNIEQDTTAPLLAQINKGQGGVFSKDVAIMDKPEFIFQPRAIQPL